MKNIKVLILRSCVVSNGKFADRGDIIEVTTEVANGLINEGAATANAAAIAAREAELGPKVEKAAAPKPAKAEKAAK